MFLTFAKVLTILFSFVSAKILSTGLTLTEYGTYSQANLINSIGTSMILLGLGDALSYYFNRKDGDITEGLRRKIVNTVFFCEIAVGIILAAVIILGQNAIVLYFDNPAIRLLLPLVCVLPAFANLIYFYKILLVGVGKARIMSFLSLFLVVVRIIAVYLAVYTVNNLLLIYAVILFMDIVQITVYEIVLRRRGMGVNPFRISGSHIKPIFAYGLPMGVFAITSSLSRDIDKLIIGRIGGTEELAIYTNCSKLLPLDIIVTSFAMVLIPYIYGRVSEGRKEESADLFSSYLKVGYYSVWTFGTMLLIAPETVISFLYADEYVAGTAVFVLYIFDSMLRFASIHLVLTAAGKSKLIMVYSISTMALNFVLNIAFYYAWGMIGPAIATLISAFVYTLLILISTIRFIDVRWSDIFKLREILPFVIALAVTWLLTRLLNDALCVWGVHAYISMIVSMATFGLTIAAFFFKKIFAVLKKINSFKL